MATQQTATVPVVSAWYSKINWTQALGMAVTGATVLGIDVDPKTQVEIITATQSIVAVGTWFFRTFMNKSVAPSSLGK